MHAHSSNPTARIYNTPATLQVTGTLSVTLVMNLRRFVSRSRVVERIEQLPSKAFVRIPRRKHDPPAPLSFDYFDQVRGSQAYAKMLCDLQPSTPFMEDADELRTEAYGHDLGVFRYHLRELYFFPTYRLDLAQVNPALARRLAGWTVKVRLTRYGFVVVKLEQELRNTPLVNVSRRLLEISTLR